ncbi:hypothetical protein C8N33_103103 [Pararhodobacter aggregans]|nr:hypothetical protein C8N33_103103 [Pararhodobacter aggregans]
MSSASCQRLAAARRPCREPPATACDADPAVKDPCRCALIGERHAGARPDLPASRGLGQAAGGDLCHGARPARPACPARGSGAAAHRLGCRRLATVAKSRWPGISLIRPVCGRRALGVTRGSAVGRSNEASRIGPSRWTGDRRRARARRSVSVVRRRPASGRAACDAAPPSCRNAGPVEACPARALAPSRNAPRGMRGPRSGSGGHAAFAIPPPASPARGQGAP